MEETAKACMHQIRYSETGSSSKKEQLSIAVYLTAQPDPYTLVKMQKSWKVVQCVDRLPCVKGLSSRWGQKFMDPPHLVPDQKSAVKFRTASFRQTPIKHMMDI